METTSTFLWGQVPNTLKVDLSLGIILMCRSKFVSAQMFGWGKLFIVLITTDVDFPTTRIRARLSSHRRRKKTLTFSKYKVNNIQIQSDYPRIYLNKIRVPRGVALHFLFPLLYVCTLKNLKKWTVKKMRMIWSKKWEWLTFILLTLHFYYKKNLTFFVLLVF